MTQVLVAGATGYLGRHLVGELKGRDYQVRVLVRRKEQVEQFQSVADDVFLGQVTSVETLRGVAEGCDIVFSCVGITHQKDGFTYEDVDYQGNVNLLREALAAEVQRFVYIGVFNGRRMQHLAMVDAKERFVDVLRESPIQYTIMRPTGFFVDFDAMLQMAEQGRIILLGDGSQQLNPISGADLASAVIDATEDERVEVELGGPVVYTLDEIAELAAEAVGIAPSIWHVPLWLARFARSVLRVVTPVSFYGPIEFFIEAAATPMTAPPVGKETLTRYFQGQAAKRTSEIAA